MLLNKPVDTSEQIITFPFSKNNQPDFSAPTCGMTLRSAGSMRFRWAETNPNRNEKLRLLCEKDRLIPVPVELIHSRIVYAVSSADETEQKQGDGIITQNPELLPVVTVADCVPIYLWDEKKQVFGIVHSGWKGTGIAVSAIELAAEKYGSSPDDFSVIIGPHIHSCCYIVNEERAEYFANNFTEECVVEFLQRGQSKLCDGISSDKSTENFLQKGQSNLNSLNNPTSIPVTWNNGTGRLYRLSLEKANLAAIKKVGVKDENITLCSDCTCCNPIFGSNRRQTANGEEFTVQAAFISKGLTI